MKFDREIIIGIIICAVILFGWGPFARSMGWMPSENAQTEKVEKPKPDAATEKSEGETKKAEAETPSEAKTETVKTGAAEKKPEEKSVAAKPDKAPEAKADKDKTAGKATEKPAPAELPQPPELDDICLENSDVRVTIDPNTGAVTEIQLKKYKASIPLEEQSGFFRPAKHPDLKNAPPMTIVTADKEKKISSGALNLAIKDKDDKWRVVSVTPSKKEDGRALTLVRKLVNSADPEEAFTVTQEWSIGKDGYKIDYQATITNSGSKTLTLPEMQVGGGVLGSSQQVSGDDVRGDSHYLDYREAGGDHKDLAANAGGGGCSCSSGDSDAKFRAIGNPSVQWAALSNKYFCMILSSKTPHDMVVDRTGEPKNEKSIVLAVGMNVSDGSRKLDPGGSVNYTFDYYCGPKILNNLNNFNDSTDKVMHLSWGPLNYLARFMLWILVKLHALIGSYGVSIIILTLLVRLLFYPITARGNASMKKMQEVQPKLKELREKYKDNPQLMNTKMMELYRAEGINPFGGCLPILLQIPVFFALYSTFNGAVELRQSSFLWCYNLAAPDTVAYIFSIPINPLVLIMTALMILQQYLTPMSMDPAQKKMMMIMPVVMLFLFYNLPSGLTLYWTVSNIFSIIQLRLQQRGSKTTEAAPAAKN